MKKIVSLLMIFSLFLVFINIHNVYAVTTYYSYLTRNIPDGYYASLDLNQSASNFIADLSTIIDSGTNMYSYGSGMEPVLEESDPVLGQGGKITCFYTGVAYSSGWNKEHVWAKSHGFPTKSAYPYRDLHHLRPTEITINSRRGNSDFGEVSNPTGEDEYGNKWTSSVFEPRDEVKGDVARIIFYMATRYSYAPFNLTVVNSTVTSTSDGNGRIGHLNTLLKWHYQDPVSEVEIHRNEVIYKYQKNRNPYIDHPEWVDIAFPNDISPIEVDQEKILEVNELISSIPANITLADEALINLANEKYMALNQKEKALVNYSIIENALKKIEELKKPIETISELFVKYKAQGRLAAYYTKTEYDGSVDYVANFKSIRQENQVIDAFPYGFVSNVDVENSVIDEANGIKMGTAKQGGKITISLKNTSDVISTVSIKVSPWISNGSVEAGNVLLKAVRLDGTYSSNRIELTSDQIYDLMVYPNDNIKEIIIEANDSRCFIHSLTATIPNPSPSYKVNTVALQLGVSGLNSQFTNDYDFGVLYSTKAIDTASINVNNLDSLTDIINIRCGVVGGSLVVNVNPTDYDQTYYAVCYMIYEGKLYFTAQSSYSVNELVGYYLTNSETLGINDELIGVLKSIY